MKLLPKMLLVAWVIALLPLAGVGWVLTREMNLLSHRNTATAQNTLARRTVDAVLLRMDRAIDLLSFLGRMSDLTGPSAERTLAAAMDSSTFFTDLWVYDNAGEARAYVHRPGDSPRIAANEWPLARKIQ